MYVSLENLSLKRRSTKTPINTSLVKKLPNCKSAGHVCEHVCINNMSGYQLIYIVFPSTNHQPLWIYTPVTVNGLCIYMDKYVIKCEPDVISE